MDSDELEQAVQKLEPATDKEMVEWSRKALVIMQCGIGGAQTGQFLCVVKRALVEKRERATLAQILAALGIGPQQIRMGGKQPEKEAGDVRADD